jgi:Fe2+ or Zn2+ uptake regulation protein
MAEWKHEHGNLVEDASGKLKSHGGRMTDQRRFILEAFRSASEHPTAGEIFRIARRRDSDLNLATVYRTVRWLEREGLVQARVFEPGSRSERFDSARPAAHHHFVCSACQRIIEFDASGLAEVIRVLAKQYALQVDQSTLVLHGVCFDCRSAAKAHGRSAKRNRIARGL